MCAGVICSSDSKPMAMVTCMHTAVHCQAHNCTLHKLLGVQLQGGLQLRSGLQLLLGLQQHQASCKRRTLLPLTQITARFFIPHSGKPASQKPTWSCSGAFAEGGCCHYSRQQRAAASSPARTPLLIINPLSRSQLPTIPPTPHICLNSTPHSKLPALIPAPHHS